MKKLWVSLLAMLLVCTMLSGVCAETVLDFDAEVDAWEDEATYEVEVKELPEFEIGGDEEEETADQIDVIENGVIAEDVAVLAPALSDFTLSYDRKRLSRYTGSDENVYIPEDLGIEQIGSGAFTGTNVTKVVVPTGVTSLANSAFSEADMLTSVTLPSTLTTIDNYAFKDCVNLKSAVIPGSVNKLGAGIFQGCINLESVTIQEGTTIIDEAAFSSCSRLKNISLPSTIKIIKSGAFRDCDSLTSFTIPDNVTTLGGSIFVGCDNLTSVVVPKSVTVIGDGVLGYDSRAKMRVYNDSYAHQYCEQNGIPYEVIDLPHVHTVVEDPAVAATCTSDGKTAGSHCSTCGEVIKVQKTVKATGHIAVNVKGKAATCTATGLTDGTKCSACGTWIKAQQTIAKKAHTPTTVKGYAATYVKAGLSDGSKCSVCGTTLTAQKTIARKTYPGSVLAKKGKNGTITVNLGEQFLLTPAFATSAGLTVKGYKSSKKKVAVVDGSGIVTAKAEGKATITVTTNNKKKKATVVVKVVDPYKPTGISITGGKKVTLEMGKTLKLGAKMKPDTAQSNLTWKSSKKSVASVDGSGLVTPHKEGTAKITVTTRNKKKTTITVKVVDPYKPTGVSITNGKTVTIKAGQTLKLGTQLKPTTAQSELSWKSANKKIATVDATGTVKALKKGKVKITVTSKKNKKVKATITVKVEP